MHMACTIYSRHDSSKVMCRRDFTTACFIPFPNAVSRRILISEKTVKYIGKLDIALGSENIRSEGPISVCRSQTVDAVQTQVRTW
jgi:hypothetical protein